MSYGCRFDSPKLPGQTPDRSFGSDLAPRLVRAVTGDVDLSAYSTESNQYALSSCTGNATADALEVLNAIEGLPSVQLSRLFIYTLARNLEDYDRDGRGDIHRDDGTQIRLCFDVLSKFGVCREDLPAGAGGWPYDPGKVGILPDLKSMRAATAHRIHSYYRIYEEGQARIDRMLEALRSRHPIVFGTVIDESFQRVSDSSPWVRTGSSIGRHAMVVLGHIHGSGFLVKNSWGSDWGFNGFCFMKPEQFISDDAQDIWVPTKGTGFKP